MACANCFSPFPRWRVVVVFHRPACAVQRANLHLLRGHDLACWCKLGSPCHRDVLLRYANEWASSEAGAGMRKAILPASLSFLTPEAVAQRSLSASGLLVIRPSRMSLKARRSRRTHPPFTRPPTGRDLFAPFRRLSRGPRHRPDRRGGRQLERRPQPPPPDVADPSRLVRLEEFLERQRDVGVLSVGERVKPGPPGRRERIPSRRPAQRMRD